MSYSRAWLQLRMLVLTALVGVVFVNIVLAQIKQHPPVFESESIVIMQSLVSLPDDNCSGLSLPKQAAVKEDRWHMPSDVLSLWLRIGCSPKYPHFHVERLIEANRWLIFATIFMATILARISTSSWTVALIVCATLLSSTQPTQAISIIGAHNIFLFLFTCWFTALAYYLRSGSLYAACSLVTVSLLSAYLGQANLILGCMAVPVFVIFSSQLRQFLIQPILKKTRFHNKRLQSAQSGQINLPPVLHSRQRTSFFSALSRSVLDYRLMPAPIKLSASQSKSPFFVFDVPFSTWVFSRTQWKKFVINWTGMIVLLLTFSIFYFISSDFFNFSNLLENSHNMLTIANDFSWQNWLAFLSDTANQRLLICTLCIAVCAIVPPYLSVNSFFEMSWHVLISLVLIILGSCLLSVPFHESESAGFTLIHLQSLISWLEPTIITMGIASIFNIIQAADNLAQAHRI